ncbi:MAG: hypothetical protein E6G85_02990 [Alphaproteobacteria bacterium]|nr:MAG: hypothetical protein E6G85_02990 [Alphaproteobacteria bacterium]
MKWRLWTRNEGLAPAVEAFHTEEYGSKEAALEAAYQMMYGLGHQRNMKVPRIDGPNGPIESEEIEAWCKARRG